MDIISFNEAATANSRIENFIKNPDSTSGVLTVPKTIAAGETITIPTGRVAILPDLQVDGNLVVDGDLFIPTGSMTSQVVHKVASTDNAVVRFDGVTGQVQDSKVVISDNGYISANGTTSGEHVFKPNTTSELVRVSATASDYSSLPSWMSTSIFQYGSTATGNYLGAIPNANLGALWGQNISNMIIGNNSGAPLIFVNGSTERMRIDISGNVGIGTSSPANSKFNRTFTTQVTGTSSSVAITAGDYSSGVASTVTVIESLGAREDANTTFGGRFGASYRRTNGEVIPFGTTIGYYAFGGQWGTDVGYVPSKHLYTASICGVAEGAFTSSTAMATGISFRTGSTGESLGNVNTTYGTERMRIDSAGKVSIGTGGDSRYGLLGVNGQLGVNCSSLDVISARGLQFFIDGIKHGNLSVDNYDNLLYIGNGIGYGTGAGGTVTQLTSKGTTVTLNKPSGLIATANSALAAGASATFTLNNNQIGENDGFYITPHYGYIDPYNYKIETISTFNGGARVKITNISTGSLSDIVQFKFQILKGAIA